MSRQALDLRRSRQILWRHKIVFAVCVLAGMVGNAAHTFLQPQTFTSSTLVVLSPRVNLDTQAVVVDSIPVLSGALSRASLGMSITELQGHVQASNAWTQMISIEVRGPSAAWTQAAANAVTDSYVAYVTSASNPGGPEPASVFLPATTPTVKPMTTRLFEAGLLGFLFGVIAGVIAALALGRNDRRLRLRDSIADSIGVPVMASLTVRAPSDAAGWTRFLTAREAAGTAGSSRSASSAEVSATDAWRLRQVLRDLGVSDSQAPGSRGGPRGTSVTVLSVASDRAALALGPRLAAFAAARGIPAMLVIGPAGSALAGRASGLGASGSGLGGAGGPSSAGSRGGAGRGAALTEAIAISASTSVMGTASKAIAALRSGAESAAGGNLRVTVRDTNTGVEAPGGALVVAIGVVDGQAPRVAETTRSDVTLLAVTAGAVTAEQLVRVSASAAADGREIAGILVANTVPADETTGRVPQLARPVEYRMPTRFKGVVTTESR